MLCNRIKYFRDLYDVSQTEVAKATGLSQNTISNFENYIYFPSCRHALVLARYFGVTVEDLFYFVE